MLRKTWDFPGFTFKWLFLNQLRNLVVEFCNPNAILGLHEYGVVSSALFATFVKQINLIK